MGTESQMTQSTRYSNDNAQLNLGVKQKKRVVGIFWDICMYLLSSGMPRLVSPETEVWPCCHPNLATLRGFVKQSTPQVPQPTVRRCGIRRRWVLTARPGRVGVCLPTGALQGCGHRSGTKNGLNDIERILVIDLIGIDLGSRCCWLASAIASRLAMLVKSA